MILLGGAIYTHTEDTSDPSGVVSILPITGTGAGNGIGAYPTPAAVSKNPKLDLSKAKREADAADVMTQQQLLLAAVATLRDEKEYLAQTAWMFDSY